MWVAIVGDSVEMFESVRKRVSKIVVFAEVGEKDFEELKKVAEMVGCVVTEANEPKF